MSYSELKFLLQNIPANERIILGDLNARFGQFSLANRVLVNVVSVEAGCCSYTQNSVMLSYHIGKKHRLRTTGMSPYHTFGSWLIMFDSPIVT